MRRVENCPICGNRDAKVVVEANQERLQRFFAFSALKYGGLLDDWLREIELVVLWCNACSHHWYRDQPDSGKLLEMYNAGRAIARFPPASGEIANGRMLDQMVRLRRSIGGRGRPKLLDYGSGSGRWAKAAVESGFEVFAYEPAGMRLGRDNSSFETATSIQALTCRSFDAVNLEQVLEHFSDPVAELLEIRQLCSPGALLRISVPNLHRAPEGTALWKDWPFDGHRVHTMAPFEHLHGFSMRSLSVAAQRANLTLPASLNVWRNFPLEATRRLVGNLIPRVSTTFLLVAAP